MNRTKRNWKFEIGDLVLDKASSCSGIVTKRDVQSSYVMDRPIKIVDEEVYTIVGPSGSVLKYSKAKELTKLS